MYIETIPNRNSPPPSSSAKAGARATKPASAPSPTSPIRPNQKSTPSAACSRTSPLVSPQALLATQKTLPHGHVEAILTAIRKLGLDALISTRRCPERDLVLAMMAQRLLDPSSKLALTRQWHATTLAAELGVCEARENDLYQAMDWLLERQPRIGKKLAARHLHEGSLVL
jgi:hypothetical protein